MTTAAGVHGAALAEFVALGLLYFARGVPELQRMQQRAAGSATPAEQLAGRRALVVGLGSVGHAIAAKLAALDLEVWGIRRSARGQLPRRRRAGAAAGAARRRAAAVDALVLACPLTAQTRGLIGAAELGALPPGAHPGQRRARPVVDEPALIEALALRPSAPAPRSTSSPRSRCRRRARLWDLPNVLVSPHSASTLADENRRIVDLFLDNLERFLDGRPLRNRFDPARGY